MENLNRLIEEVENINPANYDDDLLLAVHNAQIVMGTFQNPLDQKYANMEWNEWQRQKAKVAALAVLYWIKTKAVDKF